MPIQCCHTVAPTFTVWLKSTISLFSCLCVNVWIYSVSCIFFCTRFICLYSGLGRGDPGLIVNPPSAYSSSGSAVSRQSQFTCLVLVCHGGFRNVCTNANQQNYWDCRCVTNAGNIQEWSEGWKTVTKQTEIASICILFLFIINKTKQNKTQNPDGTLQRSHTAWRRCWDGQA